jgi:hypothetical protein
MASEPHKVLEPLNELEQYRRWQFLESEVERLTRDRDEAASREKAYQRGCLQSEEVIERLTREKDANLAEVKRLMHKLYDDGGMQKSLIAAEARAEKAERDLAVVIGKADRLTKEYLLQAQAMEVERDAARAECSRLREAFGMDLPAPVHDLLDRLADAAVHLLNDHSCDQHGWEGIERSVKAAREAAIRIRAALSEGK